MDRWPPPFQPEGCAVKLLSRLACLGRATRHDRRGRPEPYEGDPYKGD